MLIRGLPNGVRHTHPQTGRESPVAINRNGWSRSIGAGGRNQSETLVAIVPSAHKSEVAIGYWTGDAFRVVGFLRPRLSSDWRPAVTHGARLAPCLPQEIDLVRDRRFDPDVRDWDR